MGRKIGRVIAVCLFLCGIGVFFYPTVRSKIAEYQMYREVVDFQDQVEKLKAQSAKDAGEDESGDQGMGRSVSLDTLYNEMKAYNEALHLNGQSGLKDPFSYEEQSFDLSEYGLTDEIFGYITIPKMGVELPVYLGATSENMAKGAVHLSQTSLPIGGINSNSVIAAHRGMSTAEMFRNIDLLEIGDRLTITNSWDTLTYQVCEIRIIAPDEIDAVLIQEGRDLLTIFTCHPYPENYQRYVVYCERVETENPADKGDQSSGNISQNDSENPSGDAAKQEESSQEISRDHLLDMEKKVRFLVTVLLGIAAAIGVTLGIVRLTGRGTGRGRKS